MNQQTNALPFLVRTAMLFCCLSAVSLVAQAVDVKLSVSSNDVDELEDDATVLTVTLGQAVNSDVEIELEFPARQSTADYEAETTSITIAEGELKSSTRIIPIRDWELEETESINIAIDSISGGSTFEAGDDVEVKVRDEGAMPVEKTAIGTSLYLLAYFTYLESAIDVDTVVFNLGGVNSSETKLVATNAQEH